MKFRLYVLSGDKRIAEDVELPFAPVEGNVLELPDGRRFVNVRKIGGPHEGYDGNYAVDPIRESV